ncbi:MAG TPA: hypothetical protein VLJ57_06360, partial [Burkholderiaceae bacterium]|nr:hypothetical protein [Burkholderiaceae bacterium]
MIYCNSISTRAFVRTLVALALPLLVAACGKSHGDGGHGFGGGAPAQVDIVTVATQTLPVTFEYTGQTQGAREVEVRAR